MRRLRPQRDRVGRVPAGAEHGTDQCLLGPDQPDVERVAGDALGGDGRLGGVLEGGVVLVVPPEGREDHVGRQQPDGDQDGQGFHTPDQ